MKKFRKQVVNVHGERRLVDVPADDELYKADSREEYLRSKSISRHVPLDGIILADINADVAEACEESLLLERLREALKMLSEPERRLVEHLYYDELTERETAAIYGISQPAVTKRKHKIIQKLRVILIDWL